MAQYAYVEVLMKGKSFQYVVPNFPVFKPVLREVKFRWEDQDDGTIHDFDGFARDIDPSVKLPFPCSRPAPRQLR